MRDREGDAIVRDYLFEREGIMEKYIASQTDHFDQDLIFKGMYFLWKET